MPADPKLADQHEEVCAHRDEHRRLLARDGVSHRDAHQPDHVREHERLGSPPQCFPRVARTVDMLDRSIERERERGLLWTVVDSIIDVRPLLSLSSA